jgi:hypothetical protein
MKWEDLEEARANRAASGPLSFWLRETARVDPVVSKLSLKQGVQGQESRQLKYVS